MHRIEKETNSIENGQLIRGSSKLKWAAVDPSAPFAFLPAGSKIPSGEQTLAGGIMMLEQYAYLAEIVGVVLLIASLIYVGKQLRQNTEATRAEAANTFVQATTIVVSDMVTNRDLAEVWSKAATHFDSLDDVDQQRAIMFEYRLIQGWANLFRLRSLDLMPDDQWNELVWAIENFAGRRQSVTRAWKMFKGGYKPEFQSFISERIQEEE